MADRGPPVLRAHQLGDVGVRAIVDGADAPLVERAVEAGAGAAGFPRADRSNWWSLGYLVDSHSRLDEIVPARAVARAAVPSPLRRAATEPASTYRFEGESRTLEGYLARHSATGLVIARGDTILVERYQYGRRDTHRFTSWSMAKTITAMLVGI
jgi:hypothetical protein